MPIYKPEPLKGLNSIAKEEKDAFIQEQVAAGKLPKNWRFSQADRLYKNSQFKAKYGEDFYGKITDKSSDTYMSAEMRDEFYDRAEYDKAISDKYANDPNLDFYKGMTTEGLKDLWESDIKSPEELKEEEDRLNAQRKSNEENKIKPKSRLLAAFANAGEDEDTSSMKDLAEAVALSRGNLKGEAAEKAERKIANKAQEKADKLNGVIATGMDDADIDSAINQLYKSNTKHIEDLRKREDDRIINLPSVQDAATARANQLYQKVADGETTYDDIKKTFEEVFDNDVKGEGTGSRYYTGYKNKNEMSDFGIDDMVKTLAEFSVLSDAYGDQSRAMQVIDTKMFNHAKDNQNFWKRRGNVLKGVGAKANAMLMNELFGGFADLYHAYKDSPAEYQAYKTAEEVLTKGGMGYLLNPNYWNYVDQYATWNPYEIQRINDNQGIGGNVNLYSPTGKMTGEQFVDEGFKMLGYMLPAVVISAATKDVPRNSAWATLIKNWEIAGSAASLGSAYSTGVYNEISLGAEQALNQMFDAESADFVRDYYAKNPNYIANYFKSKGIKQDDNDLLTIPTAMAAQKALYEEAKQAYFDANPERLQAYKDAKDQILEDAQRGARVDNTIETARMLVSNAFWGRWTKSQLTRDLLNKGYNPVTIAGETASQAARNTFRNKAAALTLLNGGVDNWLDDITAGIGKGLGLGDYNNYLGSVYGPEATISGEKFATNIIDGILWGAEGAEEAFYNPQTWIDGAIGAAGSVLGARINALTAIRDAVKHEGYFSKYAEPGAESTKQWEEMSAWQKLNRYVTNGITTSIADADTKYAKTQKYVEDLNTNVLPKYRKDIQEIGNILNETLDFDLVADSILEGKDIKQIGMLKSVIRMMDAMKDPVLVQTPEIQKFTDFLQRGKQGQFTQDEIQTYINDPSNLAVKNAVNSEGNSISEELAVDALQKNVNSLLKISDIYSKFSEGISKNPKFSALDVEGKTQIAVQLTLKDIWQERLEDMQDLLHTQGTEKARTNYAAEFGSVEGKQRIINSLEKVVNKYKEDLAKRNREVDIKKDILDRTSKPEEREIARQDYINSVFIRDYVKDALKENTELLQENKRATVEFDENGNAPTLSDTEIMRLSPKQRARMLSPENRRNYSPEQLRVIDALTERLKNYVDDEGYTTDLYQVALDAGTIQERVESSGKSISQVVKNPYMLRQYMERLKERRDALLVQAALDDTRKDQMAKLDSVQDAQEAVEVIFRGKHPANTADKGFYIPASVVKEYVEKNPETADKFKEATDMVQTLDDMYLAAESIFEPTEAEQMKSVMAKATRNANSKAEMIAALEDVMDAQTDSNAKLQFDRVLEKMKSYGYQRDATKARNRELERQRKQEAEALQQQEEAKRDGKNYDWSGYKVGDTVYNKDSGSAATVVGFERAQDGTNKMLLEVSYADGTKGVVRYDSITGKDKLTKEQPTPKVTEETKEEAPATPVKEETPQPEPTVIPEEQAELVGIEEVPLQIDEEGKTVSPTATQQAEVEGTPVVEVPENDASEQGNIINTGGDNVLSGNRWVEYSIDSLRDGIVKKEVPENPNSVFGKLVEWLDKLGGTEGTKLQEIIDEEFGRMITDNPDLEIKFMMMKQDNTNNPLQKVIFNVVELTPALRQKYHNESRGGVIQANGKSWLLVGTTGFDSKASPAQRKAFDIMKAPISQRRMEYFKGNPNEEYYVDAIAYSKVQNTTSGRIVNQRLGETEAKLQKVSELLKSAGMSLKQAAFGIQTKQVGEKSFATTKNFKDRDRLYPPRNVEDNRGRTFIMIDTANGNKIPGMIEPSMYNNLAEGSPLKDMINSMIARLFSTNYEVRRAAISELRGYLLLEDNGKNILIGKDGINTLTIRVPGMADVTQTLGANFDMLKFFKDLENANFQINVTLKSLDEPAMLKVYDDSNALMTSVASMRTAGMSYTIYPTDASGKPIIMTPVGNSSPGTGRSEFKTYRSVRVNNVTYEYKNGQFIDRNTKQPVDMETPLGKSCLYNQAIVEGHWVPFTTRNNKEYYNVTASDGNLFVVTRDSFGNIEFLDQRTSDKMNDSLKKQQERQQRLQNLEDVDLSEDNSPTPVEETKAPAEGSLEDLNRHLLGDFSEKPAPPKVEKPSEVAKEAQEIPSEQPKEVITDVGNKSLAELQNTENLSTFVQVAADAKYGDMLYDVLEQKDWGVTGVFASDEKILKSHGISVVGITNVEDWINLIKDCK